MSFVMPSCSSSNMRDVVNVLEYCSNGSALRKLCHNVWFYSVLFLLNMLPNQTDNADNIFVGSSSVRASVRTAGTSG
eukprot:2564065-Amphidinium_carterae.1